MHLSMCLNGYSLRPTSRWSLAARHTPTGETIRAALWHSRRFGGPLGRVLIRAARIVAMNKAPGVARGFAFRFLCVVAFSAENRKSTFPENAPFAWSHFLRKTGSPLFRKMLRR